MQASLQQSSHENELQCQIYWDEIQIKKRELKSLYRKWQACHAKSVYHTDPVPEFQHEKSKDEQPKDE